MALSGIEQVVGGLTDGQRVLIHFKLGWLYRKASKFNCRKCGTAPRRLEKPIIVKPLHGPQCGPHCE